MYFRHLCDLLRRVAAGYFLGTPTVKLLARQGLKRHNERVTAKRRLKAMDKKRGNLATILVLALAYFFAAKLGLKFAYVNPSATAVWIPTGISLTALLIWGYRVWPAIFLGAFLANLTTAGSPVTSIGISIGNTLEGVLGCYLVNALRPAGTSLKARRIFSDLPFLQEWSAQRSALQSASLPWLWGDSRTGRCTAPFGARGG